MKNEEKKKDDRPPKGTTNKLNCIITLKMNTVKIKFRPSIVADKEGTNERREYQCLLQQHIIGEVKRLEKILIESDHNGSLIVDDITEKFSESLNRHSFFSFMESVITWLRRLGKERTAENYVSALNSFMRFRKGYDVLLDEIGFELMMEYEACLKAQRTSMNTISFYMRILRAVYNRAVEKGLTEQCYPFKHVYTGIDKTVKRAIPLEAMKQIKEVDLSLRPSLDFARDMFMFSFYTRGMSFVDMAYLKKENLRNGILSYCRRKTGQRLSVKWEPCMQEIADKYPSGREYLLPIIKNPGNECKQYRNALRLVNEKLKSISAALYLSTNLSMYVARHSWASIAQSKNIPIAIISEGMGHDSETTTRIYLSTLDTSAIDRANEQILNCL